MQLPNRGFGNTENQCPGEYRRGFQVHAIGPANNNAVCLGRFEIDSGVCHTDRDDQFQIRQPANEVGAKAGSLPD
jgi:hypothetical protein